MSSLTIFQRDLFGSDTGLSGWPSDGLDDPAPALPTTAELRTVPVASGRVALGLAALQRRPDPPVVPAAPVVGRAVDGT